MAVPIIALSGAFAPEAAGKWEEEAYQQGCAVAREKAVAYLRGLDGALFARRPAGWGVVGFRSWTLVTHFGEITVERRLYRDEAGGYHFLLDEYLGWVPAQMATPSVQESVVLLTAEVSFRKAAEVLSRVTMGVLSPMSVWRLTQGTAEAVLEAEAAEVERVFGHGERPSVEGQRVVEWLFIEGDGLYVRLQREDKRFVEIKSGIAYAGWQRLPGREERYRLVGKRVYCHGLEGVAFWEGASLAWGRVWDLSRVKGVVIGGDGASWIRKGMEWFSPAQWQLDGFHLARACRRALGRERGPALFEAVRQGDEQRTREIWGKGPRRPGAQAKRAYHWLEKVIANGGGQDWRLHTAPTAAREVELRGLGTIEGTEAHLLADRMKGKGRSWSRQGALHMAKVRELAVNQEVAHWCRRPVVFLSCAVRETTSRKPRRREDAGEWLQARVPALVGPNPGKPWVRLPRELVQPHLLT